MLNINPTTFFILTLLMGLINSMLTAFAAIIVVRMNRKYEERRHWRELLFKTAMERWKQECEVILHIHKLTKKDTAIFPFDDYLLQAMKLMELADEKLTTKTIEAKLAKMTEFNRKVRAYRLKTIEEELGVETVEFENDNFREE